MDIESFRDRTIDLRKPVQVYRNLHRRDGVWFSVRQNGLIVGHAQNVALRNVKFTVQQAGRLKVLETGKKNVHAWLGGYVTELESTPEEWKVARYNPKQLTTFVDASTNEPLHAAHMATIGATGVRYC